jgi:eukaryotic-like serine/threonine-protein kinase
MLPSRLGPYRIVRKIGRGGMGTVFAGVDDSTGQTAAIKLLAAEMANHADFRERFKAEIETLRKLNHPHIVQILGYGEDQEKIFYSMELVSGSSLEEQLGRGRVFHWREVAQFGIAVARGLRHAHDRGVIHRDIKPGNLLLTEEGTLKLSDFGIARLFGNSRLTGIGSVLGTAEFMAPEQAEGRPVDPRSDLYSLGAVMYVLLARRPLYNARSFTEMLDKQRFEKPAPLRQFATDVPADMEQIIHRLLEKDPARRFGTAMVLERRLETMLENFVVLPAAPHVTVEPAPQGSQAGVEPSPIDPLALTVEATFAVGESPSPPESADGATDSPSEPKDVPSPETPAPAEPPAVSGRFIPVRPGELDHAPSERAAGSWISPQTIPLVLGLIALWGLTWYMLQPPSADGLYRRIQRQVERDSTDALDQAEEDINQFLTRYSGDLRADGVREYAEQIEIHHLEKRLERGGPQSLVERMYVDAVNTARSDLEAGIAKLQATIDLFESPGLTSGSVWRCLQLAKRRLGEFRKDYEEQSQEQRTLIQQRLDRADDLRKTDPQRAKRTYRAVLDLYEHKAWAKELVQRARTSLEEKP